MSSWKGKGIIREVEFRAEGRCEYWGMDQSLQGATFHVEHILPAARGGPTTLDNLAWSCPQCNLRKSDRIEAVDPECGESLPLFHPRHDLWSDHFQWQAYALTGKTPTGRATIAALDLNHPRRLRIRRAEEMFGLFPPG